MERLNVLIAAWRIVYKLFHWKENHWKSLQGNLYKSIGYNSVFTSWTVAWPTHAHQTSCGRTSTSSKQDTVIKTGCSQSERNSGLTQTTSEELKLCSPELGHMSGWRNLAFFLKPSVSFPNHSEWWRKEDSISTRCQMEDVGTHLTSHLFLFRKRRVTIAAFGQRHSMNVVLWTVLPQGNHFILHSHMSQGPLQRLMWHNRLRQTCYFSATHNNKIKLMKSKDGRKQHHQKLIWRARRPPCSWSAWW